MITQDRFKSISNRFKDRKVLIVGDVMLDRYYYGQTNRMSPEAPVPIVDIDNTIDNPGGSSNVALNIAMLGATPLICGIVGDDTDGEILKDQLRNDSVATDFIFKDSSRPTTVKSRIISKDHQLVRMDKESSAEISEELNARIIDSISDAIQGVDGLILQDYNKGLLNPSNISRILEIAIKHEIPVYVDPKHQNFSLYNNVRLFKPNFAEFINFNTDLADFEATGFAFKDKINCEILMITKGADGVSLFYESDHSQIPTKARKVHDVSGAGDTVISAFCLSDLCEASPSESAYISNYAAGRVCEEVGVVPIQQSMLNEIIDHLDH